VVVACSRMRRVLGCDVISEGAAERALLPTREAVVAVLRRDGMAFAVAHNHPSGNPTPSADDIDATRQLCEAASATGLQFFGHVVVTDTSWEAVPAHRAGSSRAKRDHLMRIASMHARTAGRGPDREQD
jgi:DNA repair protein RadC